MGSVDDVVVTANGWPGPMTATDWRQGCAIPDWLRYTVHFLVTDRQTGSVLGMVMVNPRIPEPTASELGWWIAPAAREHGFAAEVVSAAVRALQECTPPRPVVSATNTDSLAARRALEKTGAHELREEPIKLPNRTTVSGVWYVYPSL